MKHYKHLNDMEIEEIFFKKPSEFTKYTPKEELANALGATMYTPATKKNLSANLLNNKYPSLTTNVLCLEDAIADDEVEEGEKNLFIELNKLNQAVTAGFNVNDLPLLFIRVRNKAQLRRLLKQGEKLSLITGFNLPKFTSKNGAEYLDIIYKANKRLNESFYAMPILESPETIYMEHRMVELLTLKGIIDKYESMILNIRLGGTDFSSLFGIRRAVDFTVYDIRVISSTISDIVNLFGRACQNYTISGCVWEYFPENSRLLKPQLRATPFYEKQGNKGIKERESLINREIDGLIKEVILDKANNLVGKTIIHPSHITYVNALQVVTFEEYADALSILENQGKGVIKGENGNKMNEVKPHYNWAVKVMKTSNIYGVLNKDAEYIQLF